MAKPKSTGTKTTTTDVSDATLEQTPSRALDLLTAAGRSKPIRLALQRKGYGRKDHEEGWRLLQATAGYVESGDDGPEIDGGVRDAVVQLDELDEDVYRIVRATLRRHHPAQHDFVLNGLAPSTGDGAVLSVDRLLARLDELENGKARKPTRKQDHAALATLASRGIDAPERARLRGLVKAAQKIETILPTDEAAITRAADDHRNALIALREWYAEWSDIARSAVKRRDHLIRLGLATRKSRAKASGGTGGEGGGGAEGDDESQPRE